MINVVSLLDSAHMMLLNTLDGMQSSDWERPTVCGDWSARDLLSHLASIELLLIDLLEMRPESASKSDTLDRFCHDRSGFNSAEIANRKNDSLSTIYSEYELAHQRMRSLATPLTLAITTPHHGLRRYGSSIGESTITLGYGHKLVHAAQIATFREQRLRITAPTRSSSIFNML